MMRGNYLVKDTGKRKMPGKVCDIYNIYCVFE